MGVLWMTRAKPPKVLCVRCERKLGSGPYCPSCGYPAPWATHDERVNWELGEWDRARAPGLEAPPARRRRRRPAEELAQANGHRDAPPRDLASGSTREARATPHRAQLATKPDGPVVLTVLRLLNARIAELEKRVAELERERRPYR